MYDSCSLLTVIALAVLFAVLAVDGGRSPPPISANLSPPNQPPGYPPPPPPRGSANSPLPILILLQNHVSRHGWSYMEFAGFSIVVAYYYMRSDLFLKYLSPGFGRKLWFGFGRTIFGPRRNSFATKLWIRMKTQTA